MIFIDVDTAVTVPVNVQPMIDDTDFKSLETAITFDQAGMNLFWNFVTPGGGITQTAVTPTTSGDYDWTHIGNGMYKIEIPASGGASINNDTAGIGYFTGICDGVLPWRSPDILFRASQLNDALIENPWSATRGLSGTALPNAAADSAGGLPVSDAGGLDIDTRLEKLNVSGTLAHTDNAATFRATGFAAAGDEMRIVDGELIAAKFGASALNGLGDWATQTSVDTLNNDLADGGRTDLLIDAIKAKTDQLAFTSGGVDSYLIEVQADAITEDAIETDVFQTIATEVGINVNIAAIKAKTDQFTFTVANQVDANALTGGGGGGGGDATLANQIEMLLDLDNISASLLSVGVLVGQLTSGLEDDGSGGYRWTALALENGVGLTSAQDDKLTEIRAVTGKVDTGLEDDGSGGWQGTALFFDNAPSGSGGGGSTIINPVISNAVGSIKDSNIIAAYRSTETWRVYPLDDVDAAVDTSGMTLQIVIEGDDGVDIVVIEDADIVKTATYYEFKTTKDGANAHLGSHSWACWDITTPATREAPISKGSYSVDYVAKKDDPTP